VAKTLYHLYGFFLYDYLMNKTHLKCEDWGFEVSEEEEFAIPFHTLV
jgi:hypothetical protein